MSASHAQVLTRFLKKKTPLQTDGKTEGDVTKEALTRSIAQFTRGHSGHGLGSDESFSKSPDPLEEPGPSKDGFVGVGPLIEVDRDGPFPFGPLMRPTLGHHLLMALLFG